MPGTIITLGMEIVAAIFHALTTSLTVIIHALADTDFEDSNDEPSTSGFNLLSGKYEPGGVYMEEDDT